MFLLSIITIMMFHTAVPHVHHIHTTTQVDNHVHLNHPENHHDHSTHSHHEKSDFLADLLDELAHGVHADEYLSSDDLVNFDFISKIEPIPFLEMRLEPFIGSPQIEANNLHLFALYKHGHYSNPLLLSYSLRGPPYAG